MTTDDSNNNNNNIKVVHCKKEPNFDIYIGRPNRFVRLSIEQASWPDPYKWGNPFKIGRDGTREEVIIKYREWILTQPELLKQLPELYGKTLGCWCAPLPCHGDVLKELAEQQQLLKGEGEGE
jgi:hypothetical protein